MGKSGDSRLKRTTFKLNALLDITIAINENVSTEELIRRFEKLLVDDLQIGKVMMIKLGEQWNCLLNSGFSYDFFETLSINDLLDYNEIKYITSKPQNFPEPVDIVIPVTDKDKPISYILIGDIDEEGHLVSPIIKHARYIQTLSNIITVAIENKRLFKESLQQEALKREMELASRMQTMLIPANERLPSNENIQMSAFYHPHYDVGGDYYDVLELNENEIGFCIADVSGKGISAAILMSNFQANLQALFTEEISLEKLVTKLNKRVMDSANGEKFITLFVAKYNYTSRELKYINAGHNPPLMYHINSKEIVLMKNGTVGMGMLDDLPFVNEQLVILDEPSKLFCYTDGLVEVLDESGVEFGTDKLEVELTNSEKIESNINSIIAKQKILEDNASIFDDISMIGLDFPGIRK